MSKGIRVSLVLLAAPIIAVLVMFCDVSYANDYGGEGFDLRFPAALTRFSTYADVAGAGNASAASKWSTSVNPASTDWLKLESPVGVNLCPQYANLHFENGTDINIFMESVTVDGREYGTFIAGAAQIGSNTMAQRDDVDFYFTGDMYLGQWGKRLSDETAVGCAFQYTKSLLRNSIMETIQLGKCESELYLFRFGGLHQLAEKWRVGGVVEYGWSNDRTDMYAVPALGMPAAKISDQTHEILLRPGVAYEYMELGTIYLDYQYGAFWNHGGSLDVHRLYAGVDHGFTKYLYGRAGTTLDTEGGAGWSAGFGFYPTSWFSLDAAYQMAMFPEIDHEFGKAHTVQLSVSFAF